MIAFKAVNNTKKFCWVTVYGKFAKSWSVKDLKKGGTEKKGYSWVPNNGEYLSTISFYKTSWLQRECSKYGRLYIDSF